MKLSPPASSSDLDAAREIARRLHQRRRREDRPRLEESPANDSGPSLIPSAPRAGTPFEPRRPAPRRPEPPVPPFHEPLAPARMPEPLAPPTWDEPGGPDAPALDALDALAGLGGAAAPDESSPGMDVHGLGLEEPGVPAEEVGVSAEEMDVSPDEMGVSPEEMGASPDEMGVSPEEMVGMPEGPSFEDLAGGGEPLPPSPFDEDLGDSPSEAEEVVEVHAGPSWDEVVLSCLEVAKARGAMLIDPAGQVFASRGEWPDPGPDAIAKKLVSTLDRTLKDAPTRSISAPLVGKHLTAWRVPLAEGLMTIAFLGEAPVRAEARPAIDAEIHRGPGA